MNVTNAKTGWFARQPLTSFSKLTIVALLGAAVASGVLALLVGFPSNSALLFVTAGLLVASGLAATGFRWMPWPITVISGVFLYEASATPYVTYHFTNPKTGGFLFFALDVLIVTWLIIAFGAALGSLVQSLRAGERRLPRWTTAALAGVAGLMLGAILMAAIVQPAAPTQGSTGTTLTNGVPTVHMSAGNFTQSSVTISKGSKLLLVDDTSVPHILANGAWQNGTARPAREAGAPLVNNVQVNNSSVTIGPFAVAGTYHIYCTIHQGMNLTVIVQ